MKLIGMLKKQVEETDNKEEKKNLIEKAGMLLTDDELDQVIGGIILPKPSGESDEKDSKVGFERLDRNGDNPFFLHH